MSEKSKSEKSGPTVEINFAFRQKLDEVLGGNHHNFCYQCGACVAQCPAAKYSGSFNPRQIMLDALLGREDVLMADDSPIWLCTNCYSCYERCPQDVRPIEVIVALKNMANDREAAPPQISSFTDNITKTGLSGLITPAIQKMREGLGLPKLEEAPVDEMLKILED
jgi:heterodisulfide reductase subunit C